ncbi:MAG: riboflavin synthase [Alphaproteobacteria bacterium]|nr:riboflavin synthase [Alphaproteobacteria bacterium]
MFTGIVQDTGTVVEVTKNGDWTLKIKASKLSLLNMPVGASIACSGVCLTIIAKTYNTFTVQCSAETLSKTTIMNWQPDTVINLEPPLRLGDDLGGHMVTGHVDGVAFVAAKKKIGDSISFQFDAPHELSRFLAPKGSVAIDGVSLTVNGVDHALFKVNIIPHTQSVTTLGKLSVGDAVNLEADILARYAERLLHAKLDD